MIDILVMILIIAAALAVNLYAAFYAFRPWRSTPQGRALMIKSVGNVIVLDMSLLYAVLGDYPFRDAVRVLGFATFAVGIWYLLITLLTSPGADRYPPRSWLPRRVRHQSGDPR